MTTRMAGCLARMVAFVSAPRLWLPFCEIGLIIGRVSYRRGSAISGQHLLREAVAGLIRVVPDAAKFFLDAQAGGAAKIIRQLEQFLFVRAVCFGLQESFGAQTGRGDGEQFGADLHEAAEEQLLSLQFRAVAEHGVEERPRQSPAGSRGIA